MVKIKNIGIITSGGDSPGMNSVIQTIVNYSNIKRINCIGFKYGYSGLINNKFIKLNKIKDIIGYGGSVIGCGRSKDFMTKEGREKAYKNLIYNKIDGLIIIGGNGTFKGVNIFIKKYNIPIIGIPGTIDNDIYGTDYTIGYDTALNTIISTVDKIKDTANTNNRIFIIEVMGRNTGFLAINSGIALNSLYVIYNNNYSIKKIIKFVLKKRKFSNIIIVAENNKIGESSKIIYNKIKSKINDKKIEFRRNVLGHIQRCGSPTYLDRILATRFSIESINRLINFNNYIVIGIKNNKIINIPFKQSINKKKIDKNSIYILNNFYK